MRWQAKVMPRQDRPDDTVPDGWDAKGADGAWCPVGLEGGCVLWRRMLVPARAKAQPRLAPWIPAPLPPGIAAEEIRQTVRAVISAVTRSPVDLQRCNVAARPLMALWRSLGWPPADEFCADALAVAEAAHRSSHPLFARDIRAEGWAGGVPRQHDIATICVQERWPERLRVARAEAGLSDVEAAADPEEEAPPPRMDF